MTGVQYAPMVIDIIHFAPYLLMNHVCMIPTVNTSAVRHEELLVSDKNSSARGGRTERNRRQRVAGDVLEGIVRVVRGVDERVGARQVRMYRAVDEGRRPEQEQRRRGQTTERHHDHHGPGKRECAKIRGLGDAYLT